MVSGYRVDILKHMGMTGWSRGRLKREMNAGASWSGRFSTLPGMPCGPAAFLLLAYLGALLTSWNTGGPNRPGHQPGCANASCAAGSANSVLKLLASKHAQKVFKWSTSEECVTAEMCVQPL